MSATWTWVLANQNGTQLTELANAAGRVLTFRRNSHAEAMCVISHEDDEAGFLFDALRVGTPTLQCYRNGTLRFNGYLAPFAEDLEEAATITLAFRSPFAQLVGDGAARGRFTGPETAAASRFTATDAGQIAKALIDTANALGYTGLATTGSIAATRTRDRTYNYANVGQAIIALSTVLDGFDFTEAFTLGGTTLAQLVVYAIQGQDRPNAKFEYGADTLNNVRHVKRSTEPPINYAVVNGANNLTATRDHAASRALRGTWPILQTQSDVSDQTTLNDKAQALLRPDPVKVVTFSPDPDLAPEPWEDWWLGDTVYFYGHRSSFVETFSGRVNMAQIVVDDDGHEATDIPDPLTPNEGATIRARLGVEAIA